MQAQLGGIASDSFDSHQESEGRLSHEICARLEADDGTQELMSELTNSDLLGSASEDEIDGGDLAPSLGHRDRFHKEVSTSYFDIIVA